MYDTANLIAASSLLHPNPIATMARLNSTEALPDSIGHNLGLSYAQCDVGFSKFWPELYRTKDLFTRGKTGKDYGITQADLDKVEENDGTRVSPTRGRERVCCDERVAQPTRLTTPLIRLFPLSFWQVAIIDGQVYGKPSTHSPEADQFQQAIH